MLIESVRKDLLELITKIIPLYETYQADAIKGLSNNIIHSASIYQDEISIKAAVIIYSIGKIIDKGKEKRYPQRKWEAFRKVVGPELRRAKEALEQGNEKKLLTSFNRIEKAIMNLDKSYMQYVEFVIDKAKLKKGAKMYEHGVSLRQVAELLGISEWDLMHYSGKTRIFDRDKIKTDIKKRLMRARRLLE